MISVYDHLQVEETRSSVMKLFPDEQNMFIGNDCRISGLSKEAVPVADYVLDSFKWDDASDRTFYLVRIPDSKAIALIRVCEAMAGSGYDQFCTIHEISENAMHAESIKITFNRWKDR